ncbi:hypothetical protein K6Y31_12485 [Motilimonas cestriensis]|uniref:Uncharacterized protein n=1 Tax=Motilimonas cestriensis TaxID=2742685 RepID=A0ABS8WBG8_9GAMM|nr:hypothetical protein [Motilimonas cestriensis]MCE2595637.1 hypothetical protein [Motilimonas cestriensis]
MARPVKKFDTLYKGLKRHLVTSVDPNYEEKGIARLDGHRCDANQLIKSDCLDDCLFFWLDLMYFEGLEAVASGRIERSVKILALNQEVFNRIDLLTPYEKEGYNDAMLSVLPIYRSLMLMANGKAYDIEKDFEQLQDLLQYIDEYYVEGQFKKDLQLIAKLIDLQRDVITTEDFLNAFSWQPDNLGEQLDLWYLDRINDKYDYIASNTLPITPFALWAIREVLHAKGHEIQGHSQFLQPFIPLDVNEMEHIHISDSFDYFYQTICSMKVAIVNDELAISFQ